MSFLLQDFSVGYEMNIFLELVQYYIEAILDTEGCGMTWFCEGLDCSID